MLPVEQLRARSVAAHFLDLRGFLNGSYGPACCRHPSAEVDAHMAQRGVEAIRSVTGWDTPSADISTAG
eukprot:1185380-Prorocentrum_minimum.AAC.1